MRCCKPVAYLLPVTRPALTPLTGGVSSEIFRDRSAVRTRLCEASFAQAKSRARLVRSRRAQRSRGCLDSDGASDPSGGCAKADRGRCQRPWFRDDDLDPNRYPCWKGSLRDGVINPAFAKTVGEVIGKIHARTAKKGDVAASFPNQALFEVLRMEPYLRSTATRHPDFAGRLNELAETTLATRLALMHGDVSPKNILQGPDGPVFLDSECACNGDPAFDLAFGLNHLLLKSVGGRNGATATCSVSSRSSLATGRNSIGKGRQTWRRVPLVSCPRYYWRESWKIAGRVHHHRCPEGECNGFRDA